MVSFAWSGGCFSQLLEPAEVATDTETGTSTDTTDPSTPNVTTFDSTGPVQPTSTGNGVDHGASEGESSGGEQTGVRMTEGGGSTSAGSDFSGTESSQDTSELDGLCCFSHPAPGCDDVVGGETCVCKFDSYCCDVQWDDVCVDIAIAAGCIDCGEPAIPDGPSDCCEATNASGCLDVEVESCACEFDAFCCNVQWDETCVIVVEENKCGCGFGSSAETDTDTDTGGQQDCCSPTPASGCMDGDIESCVCATEPFCCDTAWDNQCVALVNLLECGSCAYPPGEGDCCQANGSPGCNDQAQQDCVCADDVYCCTVAWDETCASSASMLACGSCSAGGTGTGV